MGTVTGLIAALIGCLDRANQPPKTPLSFHSPDFITLIIEFHLFFLCLSIIFFALFFITLYTWVHLDILFLVTVTCQSQLYGQLISVMDGREIKQKKGHTRSGWCRKYFSLKASLTKPSLLSHIRVLWCVPRSNHYDTIGSGVPVPYMYSMRDTYVGRYL